MKKENESKELIIEEMIHAEKQFAGYTIEQVKYQRALVALKRQFMKEKIEADVKAIKRRMTPGSGKSSSGNTALSVVSSLASRLNYVEYIMIGVSLFGTVRKIRGLFKKK